MHEFFLCISVQIDMALTSLCRALCLLLCKKFEIPSNAKAIKPVIIVLKIPPFSVHWEIWVILNIPHSLIYDVWYCYGLLSAFYTIPRMVLILHNTRVKFLYSP